MATLKAKTDVNIICPNCRQYLFSVNMYNDTFLTCYRKDCKNYGKLYELPEVELKEYEIKNGKKQN